MNYTERVNELFRERGYGNPSFVPAHTPLRDDLVALLQEANREAIAELHQAHAAEVSAHIETKKELQVHKALAAQALNGTPRVTEPDALETLLLSAEGWVKIGDLVKEWAAGKKHDEALVKRAEKKLEEALKSNQDQQNAFARDINRYRAVMRELKLLLEEA